MSMPTDDNIWVKKYYKISKHNQLKTETEKIEAP